MEYTLIRSADWVARKSDKTKGLRDDDDISNPTEIAASIHSQCSLCVCTRNYIIICTNIVQEHLVFYLFRPNRPTNIPWREQTRQSKWRWKKQENVGWLQQSTFGTNDIHNHLLMFLQILNGDAQRSMVRRNHYNVQISLEEDAFGTSPLRCCGYHSLSLYSTLNRSTKI